LTTTTNTDYLDEECDSDSNQCYRRAKEFSEFLLQVGNGTIPFETDIICDSLIRIPDEYVFESQCVNDLLDWIYDTNDGISLSDKAILTTKNNDVDTINEIAINNIIPGALHILESCNTAIHDNPAQAHMYTSEFMQSINGFNLPPDKLKLKVNAPIILIRNLDQKCGLCNGTRLSVTEISRFRIKSRIMNGSNVGDIVTLPRILCTPSDSLLPFSLQRRQFPIKLAFALTINKSQGQSLKKVGVYLPQPVFTHGQLYVALSRCGDPENTKVLIKQVEGVQGMLPGKEGFYTRNIVYSEALSKT